MPELSTSSSHSWSSTRCFEYDFSSSSLINNSFMKCAFLLQSPIYLPYKVVPVNNYFSVWKVCFSHIYESLIHITWEIFYIHAFGLIESLKVFNQTCTLSWVEYIKNFVFYRIHNNSLILFGSGIPFKLIYWYSFPNSIRWIVKCTKYLIYSVSRNISFVGCLCNSYCTTERMSNELGQSFLIKNSIRL